ncbi:MAG: hypothetical protein QGG42_18405, partial [Phycisphaerae bacterium]|nr:hypothetical protein [Phycisphaerae bacterium]
MNIYAYRYDSGGGCIVLVDYQESMVNIDDRSGSASRLLQSARHFERVNYLLSDGSVKTASPMQISPQTNIEAWLP